MMYEQNVTVLGGLPLVAKYNIARAEPDVGIMSSYPHDIALFDNHGRPAMWAEVKLSSDAWDALSEQIMENHDGSAS